MRLFSVSWDIFSKRALAFVSEVVERALVDTGSSDCELREGLLSRLPELPIVERGVQGPGNPLGIRIAGTGSLWTVPRSCTRPQLAERPTMLTRLGPIHGNCLYHRAMKVVVTLDGHRCAAVLTVVPEDLLNASPHLSESEQFRSDSRQVLRSPAQMRTVAGPSDSEHPEVGSGSPGRLCLGTWPLQPWA